MGVGEEIRGARRVPGTLNKRGALGQGVARIRLTIDLPQAETGPCRILGEVEPGLGQV